MLNHGGNLRLAKSQFPHVGDDWLDLSTGISPWTWPVPDIPASVWQSLPLRSERFDAVVHQYYGVADLVPVAGSQVAIELLPQCLPPAKVALPRWGYGEHARSWQRAGHEIVFYDSEPELQLMISQVEHAVVINPNNPTGEQWSLAQLRQIQASISGYLLVDEAFIDCADVLASQKAQAISPSMLPYIRDGSLLVLRSMGKFFGLAGIRLGFVGLPDGLREQFMDRLNLWAISGPALWVAERALSDSNWQQQQCRRIQSRHQELLGLLEQELPNCRVGGSSLFVSVKGSQDQLNDVFRQCAEQGI